MPAGGAKRKRGDRSWSGDSGNDGTRPSPHRPGNLTLAQQQQAQSQGQNRDGPDSRGRGGRRASRGGRGNRRPSDGPNFQQRDNQPASSAMSPAVQSEAETPQTDAAPATPATNAVPPQTPVASKRRNSSYHYAYLTQDCVSNWTTTGKQKLVEEGGNARAKEDTVTLASVFQEIVQSVFDGRISAVDGGTCIKTIIGEPEKQDGDEEVPSSNGMFDARSVFLDTLSILTDSDTSLPSLRPLVFSTDIDPNLMRLQLETPLLQSLGLIRDTFARVGIRKQTNILYRQSNYNLLREESEGYSKLLTELFTTSNNEPPSSDVVEDTFERVKGMIGAFDMDVGRVLDVTLDVFAAVLVKQYRFCVKFLRASSWWPKEDVPERPGGESGLPKWALPGSPGWITTEEEREETLRLNVHRDRLFWDRVKDVGIQAFFEIGRQVASEKDRRRSTTILDDAAAAEENETLHWIQQTGTLPPRGNRVAAQLLGFKLRFYSSQTRDPSDVLPDNLIYLAALLIKVGFISLRDLYPHLWRSDESMGDLKEEKSNEKLEREKAARPGGGAANALMAAGALTDDTLPLPPKTREANTRSGTPSKDQEQEKAKSDDKEKLPEPADQKVLLLKSLLAIGALPESLFILGRFPWLLDLYPELPEYIHRILHHCLSKVYGSLRPLPGREHIKDKKKVISSDQSTLPQGTVRLTDPAPRRVLRWALLDKEDTNDGTDYRFYWDDWADNIPICQSVDDVFALCSSFLNLSGFKIGQDPSLLSKLARIGKQSLEDDPSESNKARWKDLCKRLLVPSLSLTKANPGVVNEVFALLSHYHREERYAIYAEWYFGQISRMPDIKAAFDQSRPETKDALKRLSKTNIRPMARTLAKAAYANPGIVINVAVSQIESYENLIEVVVECARYFTDLGYDILTWSLINSLGQKGRSRLQESGLLTSRWLNALASFAGRAFKRYSSIMNPTPLLQYVAEQLRQNNATDLIVLEQLISSMAGIVTDTNFNEAQTQAMAGGHIMQSQTMLQLLDKRHESKSTSKRLMKALTDTKLAGQLLIAIAQERVTCVFKESEAEAELKLLGNIFDEIHRVLTQYVDLLRSNLSVEEFDSFVPDVSQLMGEFGLQPEVAFWVSRTSIAKMIADFDEQNQEAESANKPESGSATALKSPDGDVVMVDEQGKEVKEDGSGDAMAIDQTPKSETDETQNGEQPLNNGTSAPPAEVEDLAPWHPVLEEVMEKVKPTLSESTWAVIGLPFYVTFWQLSLYDIYVPQKSYEDELERLKKRVVTISNDRSDVSMAGTQKKDREKKQINELHDRILEENKQHLRAYGHTRSRLQKEKVKWFEGMRQKHEALNIAIMQECLLPRTLLSPIDALFSFKMLKFLHSSGTPNFRTLGLLDQLFRDQRLTGIIFQCTSKESDNFGRYLNEVLRDLGRWHADKAVYEKEAYGSKKDLPGFAMAMDADGKPTTLLDYEDFRRILYKWHRILGTSLKTCLTGGEYMHIRNAISVLKSVVQHFPAVNWIGRDLHTCVTNLKTNDPRDDVKIPAASLIGDLNRREPKWLLPQAFMINESAPSDKGAAGKARTPQARSETPKPLNATAPEFKPPAEATTNANGDQQSRAEGNKMEVEDGEISDAKAAEAKDDKAESQQPDPEDQPPPAEPSTTNAQPSTDAQKEDTEMTEPNEETSSPKPRDPAPTENIASREQETSERRRPDTNNKPATTSTPKAPKRPDADRHPNLPNRPEPPRPSRASDDRRDPRDNRYQDPPRASRYGGHDRDRAPEHANSPESRGHGRINERLAERDRPDVPPGDQFVRQGPRDSTPRHRDQGRAERNERGRLGPQDSFSPRHDTQRSHRPDDVHPSRLANTQPAPEGERPERHETSHQDRDDRRPHVSRPPSPPRGEDSRGANRGDRRDERDARRPPPPAFPAPSMSRTDEPPVGPRSDRHVPPSPVDSRPHPPPHPSDAPFSRQPHESRYPPRSQDGFEREPEIPSGPRRSIGGRGGRSGSTSISHPPARPQSPPRQPGDRQPPTGPSNRPMRIPQNQDQAQGPQPSSGAPPAAPLDTSGIHPDRLKALQSDSESFQPSQSPSPLPPSGPRNAGFPSSGPSPTTRGPPGPSFSGERGRGDKRFAGLNNMLQQGSGSQAERSAQGTSIRGRGANRQSSSSINAPVGGAVDTRPDIPSPSDTTDKADLFPQRANGTSQPPDNQREENENEFRGRPSRGGRRSEIMEDSTRSPRQTPSGVHTPDRPGNRDRDRDRDRDGSRRADDDSTRRTDSRRDDHRDRGKERDRDRAVEGRAARDDVRGSRESSSRREADNPVDTVDGGSNPRRRSRRDREERADPQSAPPAPSQPPPPPQAPSGPSEDRRWASGGRADGRPSRDRDRDRNRDRDRDRERDGERDPNRDRDRDRDRERRDGGELGRNGGPGGDPGRGGTWPRKRGRPAGSGVDDGADRGPPARGGNDNKRQRRGQ